MNYLEFVETRDRSEEKRDSKQEAKAPVLPALTPTTTSEPYSLAEYDNFYGHSYYQNEACQIHQHARRPITVELIMSTRNHGNQPTERDDDSGDISWVIPLVVGTLVSGGLGIPTLGIAVAGLRLATTAAYVTATTAAAATATAGTGYLAVKGGRLVLTAARPGVMNAIRAADVAARDIRAGAELVVGETVRRAGAIPQVVAHRAVGTLNTANTAREMVVNVTAAGAAHLATIYPDFPTVFNTAVGGRAQAEIPVRIIFQDEIGCENEDPAIGDIGSGGSIVMLEGGDDGDAVELHLMSGAIGRRVSATGEDGNDVVHGNEVYEDGRGLEEPVGIQKRSTVHVLRDRALDFDQDITDAVMVEDPELADVDWASEIASFHTASSQL